MPDARERCNGVTQEHRRRAGALLSVAMIEGVQGAAVEYAHTIMGVPREELAQARQQNPDVDKAVKTVVEKLQQSATGIARRSAC